MANLTSADSAKNDKVLKKDPRKVCLEFITAVKDRIKMPKKVDWDELCTLWSDDPNRRRGF